MTLALKKYIEEKLKILKQLDIPMDEERLAHIWACESEWAVDRYARKLICGGEDE